MGLDEEDQDTVDFLMGYHTLNLEGYKLRMQELLKDHFPDIPVHLLTELIQKGLDAHHRIDAERCQRVNLILRARYPHIVSQLTQAYDDARRGYH
jgi:hypothetical protein